MGHETRVSAAQSTPSTRFETSGTATRVLIRSDDDELSACARPIGSGPSTIGKILEQRTSGSAQGGASRFTSAMMEAGIRVAVGWRSNGIRFSVHRSIRVIIAASAGSASICLMSRVLP